MINFTIIIDSLSEPTIATKWANVANSLSNLDFTINCPKKIFATGWDADYSQRSFRVIVPVNNNSKLRAEIHYVKLAPSMFYSAMSELKNLLRKFNYTKNSFSDVGLEQSCGGPLEVRYNPFRIGGLNCIIFAGARGDGAGDGQPLAGTSKPVAYYCSGEG